MIINTLFLSSLCIFIFSYLNPMNPDVLGFVQIWNPNVVGNYFSHCTIFLLAFSKKIDKTIIFYCSLLMIFSFFTYSKASWLLILVNSVSMFLIMNKQKKLIFLLIFISFIIYYNETVLNILTLIQAKIEASGFEGSAASGSSVGARLGLAYSGFLMFLQNPFLELVLVILVSQMMC